MNSKSGFQTFKANALHLLKTLIRLDIFMVLVQKEGKAHFQRCELKCACKGMKWA